MNLKTIKVLNVVAFLAMVVVNYLANSLPINDYTTGELSDMYPNLFVPAGITFSIWGVIYLLLAIFLIVQFTAKTEKDVKAIGWWFIASCVFNISWIFAWHHLVVIGSVLIMFGLLVSLILVNWRIKGNSSLLSKGVFGIYLGWICIATIANVTTALVNFNWGGWGIPDPVWAIIMISIGGAITAMAIHFFRNPFIGLSVIWAFAGIMIERNNDNQSVFVAAGIALVLLAIFDVWQFVRLRKIV